MTEMAADVDSFTPVSARLGRLRTTCHRWTRSCASPGNLTGIPCQSWCESECQ